MHRSILEKLWYLLTPSERRDAIAILCLMLVGMILEALGIGIIVPALALLTRDDFVERMQHVGVLGGLVADLSRAQFIVGGMGALVIFYAAKVAFLSFLAWRQMRFVYGLQAELSRRLFFGYLQQPYLFHIQRNSAQLINNTLTEVNILAQNGVLQALILATELFVVLGIFALLMYVEPLGSLVTILVLVATGWLFYQATRQRMRHWGEVRQYEEGMRVQHLQQGLGAVKDVKLSGREAEFVSVYRTHTESSAAVGQRQQTLQQLPRLMLELLAVIALTVLVSVMIARDRPLDLLLPTLGVFAAAAFRLLPSTNRIMNAIQIVRFTLPTVDKLYAEFRSVENVAPSVAVTDLKFEQSLTLENVFFAYPGADSESLNGVSLSIRRGETIGFIGGSGAGKTTLVDVILGLLRPSRGSVNADGADIQCNLRGWQNRIGYVPQSVYLTDDSLRRNIAFGIPSSEIDDASIWRAARIAQIDGFIRELPEGLDTRVGERGVRLSGGQLQRIGIARALYHNPEVLVLDEATSSLDMQTERSVMESVRALHGKKTIVIVAHRLSTVEHCDRLYALEGGRIVRAGEPSKVIAATAATS